MVESGFVEPNQASDHLMNLVRAAERSDSVKSGKAISRIVICMSIGLISCSSLWASNYYRYENDEGRKVMTQTMPPQFVHKGYEILNEKGRVLEVVPRALTDEERAALSLQEKSRLDAEAQVAHDKQLLTIFSGPEDAERARDRKLEAIDAYINVTRGNILKLQGDFNEAQAQAATRERAGQAVPDFLLEKMDSLQRQIDQAEESIEEKEQEKVEISDEYQKDIDRLKYLVELRKKAKEGQVEQ